MRGLPSSHGDEAALVAALVAKEPAAASAAWDLYAPLVRGLLWQSLAVGSDVDDLTQDVFLHLFRRIADLREPAAIRSFVVGITIRVARGELRRRRLRRWLHLTDDGDLPEDAAIAVDFAAREALTHLYAILDKLDDETRLAFVLRYIRGLELTEVASALSCSLATTKRRIFHAQARIAVHARRDPCLAPFVAGDLADDQVAGASRPAGEGTGAT